MESSAQPYRVPSVASLRRPASTSPSGRGGSGKGRATTAAAPAITPRSGRITKAAVAPAGGDDDDSFVSSGDDDAGSLRGGQLQQLSRRMMPTAADAASVRRPSSASSTGRGRGDASARVAQSTAATAAASTGDAAAKKPSRRERREEAEAVVAAVLRDVIDGAAAAGDVWVRSRRRQTVFQRRVLPKPFLCAVPSFSLRVPLPAGAAGGGPPVVSVNSRSGLVAVSVPRLEGGVDGVLVMNSAAQPADLETLFDAVNVHAFDALPLAGLYRCVVCY